MTVRTDIDPETWLAELELARGSHETPDYGMCVMEAVAWLAGEEHSDHPNCVSPVLGAFLRAWNDDLPDEDRQVLNPTVEALQLSALGLLDRMIPAKEATP